MGIIYEIYHRILSLLNVQLMYLSGDFQDFLNHNRPPRCRSWDTHTIQGYKGIFLRESGFVGVSDVGG
jgi:hypothetical protein